MRAMWLSVVMLGGCVVGGGERDWSFGGVEAVAVSLGSGEVRLRSALDATETSIHWEGGGVGRDNVAPEPWLDDDGVLWLDADGGIAGGGEIAIVTPPGVTLEVVVERGEADLRLEAPADVWACVAAGELSVGVPAGSYDIDLDGGVGELGTSGIVHDPDAPWILSACVGAGEIDLYAIESRPVFDD